MAGAQLRTVNIEFIGFVMRLGAMPSKDVILPSWMPLNLIMDSSKVHQFDSWPV
jgi:hypothetical protein